MATISSPGIGSGLDVNSIVTQLVAIERQPINDLQTQASALQTKLSAFGKVQSYLSTLRDAAAALTSPSTWNQTSGTSSDATSVAVTTDANNRPGSYSVQVTQLAQAQTNISKTYASADDLVGEGTLHIELGTWGTGNTFTANPAATAVDLSVGPPAKSLAQVRDMINAANAGITATVLSDASGARLVFTSSTTGAANGFRITVADSDGGNVDTSGLSALAFDPSVGTVTMSQALAAANASALINGAPVSSATNTLTNVVDGMTLQLQRVTTSPVQITTASDKDAIQQKIQDFVKAYNDINNELATDTKYDADTKTAGTLQGDSAAVSLRYALRNMLGGTSAASTAFTRLADIGFDVQRDGTISVNSTKLDNALANLGELKKLFSNTDTVTPANNGFATLFRQFGDQALGVDGALSARTDGIRQSISRNEDRQAELEVRVSQTEDRLRKQYTALDAQMGQLQSLSTYVTQQMSILSNSSKS
ncbi:MAG TPA: flagellar filament capping protein FliD [Burkholderiaceae bacterium]|nr:flagellar filament capping protein FliD [Burkholderiaceae bacterium]